MLRRVPLGNGSSRSHSLYHHQSQPEHFPQLRTGGPIGPHVRSPCMGDHSIDQRKYARRHPSSNIQLVIIFPFVDLHLNTSIFFAMPRCVLTALEPQSTKRCNTPLLHLHPTLQNKRSQDGCLFDVTDANHTVRGTSVHHMQTW